MVRIQTRLGPPNTKEVGFKVSDLIFMKCRALVVECLFTEMCLLSLGAGFDIPPSNCIYIYLRAFFFLPLHDGTRVYLAPTWRRAVLRRD